MILHARLKQYCFNSISGKPHLSYDVWWNDLLTINECKEIRNIGLNLHEDTNSHTMTYVPAYEFEDQKPEPDWVQFDCSIPARVFDYLANVSDEIEVHVNLNIMGNENLNYGFAPDGSMVNWTVKNLTDIGKIDLYGITIIYDKKINIKSNVDD